MSGDSGPRTSDSNESHSPSDQQSFTEIVTQGDEKKVEQKSQDNWLLHSAQTKLHEVKSVHDEQALQIHELKMKNVLLQSSLKDEEKRRATIVDTMTKIQGAMSHYNVSYNDIKNRFQSCEAARTTIFNLYKKLQGDVSDMKKNMIAIHNRYWAQKAVQAKTVLRWKELHKRAVSENRMLVLRKEEQLLKMRQQLMESEQKFTDLKTSDEGLKSVLQEVNGQKEQLLNDLKELRQQHEALQAQSVEEATEHNKRVDSLNETVLESKQKYEQLDKEHNTLQSKLDNQTNVLNEQQVRGDAMETSIAELEHSNTDLRNQISALEYQLDGDRIFYANKVLVLENDLKAMEKKNVELSLQKTRIPKGVSASKHQLLQLKTKTTTLNTEILLTTEIVNSSNAENNLLRKTSDETNADELAQQSAKITETKPTLNLQLQNAKDENEKLRSELKKSKAELEEQAKTTANEKQIIQTMIRSLNNEIEALKERAKGLKGVEDKTNEMFVQTQCYKMEVDKLREEKVQRENEMDEMFEEAKQKDLEIGKLKEKKKCLKRELKKASQYRRKERSRRNRKEMATQTETATPKEMVGQELHSNGSGTVDLPKKRSPSPSSPSYPDFSPKQRKTETNLVKLDQ